jgi:hypothetical protein
MVIRTKRMYLPSLLPRLQTLLADLADTDLAYQRGLEAILQSPGEEGMKREMIDKLQQHHRQRRSQQSEELSVLEHQIQALCATAEMEENNTASS